MSPVQENKDKKPRRKKGETAKDKVRRHVTDKNDHITEEDMRDVVVGVNAMGDEPDEPVITPEDIPEKKIITPWDVIGGENK